jgi:hypothetical protein
VLTADLPARSAEPSVQPKDLVQINQRFGSVERTGRWVVPRRMEIWLAPGGVKLVSSHSGRADTPECGKTPG